MFYVRMRERQENTTGRTPSIFLYENTPMSYCGIQVTVSYKLSIITHWFQSPQNCYNTPRSPKKQETQFREQKELVAFQTVA
jgi:hypothetical protein